MNEWHMAHLQIYAAYGEYKYKHTTRTKWVDTTLARMWKEITTYFEQKIQTHIAVLLLQLLPLICHNNS